jgi:hypothetical protein
VNTRKTNSSILFLTTLGVYLGLVLVGGAAPSVFAHGALAKNFELQDEIEVHDDLDKKPDNDTVGLSMSIKTYLEDVELFLGSLQRLGQNGKFDPSRDAFEVTQTTLLPCVPANDVGSYTANAFQLKNESLRPSLERLSKLLTDGYSLADCVPSPRFDGKEASNSKFTVKLSDGALSVEVAVQKASPEIANRVSQDLRKVFANFTPTAGEIARRKIFENTTFKSNGDHVLVITRLPRADLDPLLAQNAK